MLRGGAFNNNQNNVRCAYRNNNHPNNHNNTVGFRVVVHTPIRTPELRGGLVAFSAEAKDRRRGWFLAALATCRPGT